MNARSLMSELVAWAKLADKGVHVDVGKAAETILALDEALRAPKEMVYDQRELATMVAALSLWRNHTTTVERERGLDESDVARRAGRPLDDAEIDKLLERLDSSDSVTSLWERTAEEIACLAVDPEDGGLCFVLKVDGGSVHEAVDKRYMLEVITQAAEGAVEGLGRGRLRRDRNGNKVEGGWAFAGRFPGDEAEEPEPDSSSDPDIEPDEE